LRANATLLILKILVFIGLASPLFWLGWLIRIEIDAPTTALGADPGEAIVHFLGEWTIRLLLLAFAISPLQKLFKQPVIGQQRRMVGVFAFSYALLHLLTYLFFYIQFEWDALLEDFVERAFITVGILALLCLTPMAITSTRGWQRRLRRNWKRLHLLVYPALVLALIHFYWLTKDGFAEVVIYSTCFLLLVGFRLVRR
jgi:sulfoxide reductase heme-binding subunit YedZ